MSTRAHIRIKGEVEENKEPKVLLLYRHCDGYPDVTIPTIEKAFKMMGGSDFTWQAGRVGYVAACLCAASYNVGIKSTAIQPTTEPDLQLDIEWLYEIELTDVLSNEIAKGSQPKWKIRVFDTNIEGRINLLQDIKHKQVPTRTFFSKDDEIIEKLPSPSRNSAIVLPA